MRHLHSLSGSALRTSARQARFRPAVAERVAFDPSLPRTTNLRGGPAASDLEISSLHSTERLAASATNGLHPASAAALRDATATASTSRLDHLSLHLVQPPPQVQAQLQHSSNGNGSHHSAALGSQQHVSGNHKAADTVKDKDLYDEIKACEEWQDVLEVVADEGESMSLRSAVQALGRVNKLAKGIPHSQLEVLAAHPGLRSLVALLYSQVQAMNPIQLSNSLYACAQLGVSVPHATLQAYAARAALTAQNFWPRDISTLLYAFAMLRAEPGHDVLDRLCFRAQGLLAKGEFEPQGISMLLYSCVILGYKNSLLNRAAALQAGIQLHRFSPQAIANTAWALAHMAFYHKPVIEGALASLAARPRDFKPQEVCNILWGTTRQRHHPGAALYPIVQSLMERSASLNGRDLVTVLYTLATFNIAPGAAILRKLLGELSPQLESLGASEVASAYWSLGMLQETGQPAFAAIEARLAALHSESAPLEEHLLRMAFQGFVCSRLTGSQRAPAFAPLMLDAMKRAWIGAAAVSNSESAVLDRLVEILQQLKVRHDSRRPSKDGLVQIDIALKPSAERFVALQVVVEEDAAINTGQLLATAVFQKAVLERNGWEVKHLLVRDLHALSDQRLQPLFVAELLKSMGIKAKSIPKESLEAAKMIQEAAAAAAGSGAAKAGRAGSGASRQQQRMSETDLLMSDTQPQGGTRPLRRRA